jgi:predicted pyridoxine 5'-phosphate oxidase superfamily flavin-nucleotide-binding protein
MTGQARVPGRVFLDLKRLSFMAVDTIIGSQPRRSIMSYGFLEIATTPSVLGVQKQMHAEHLWQDFEGHREFDRFTESETAFIANRDSFYMATVSETGWPYLQHRGGPRGFLKVVDSCTLAFADYRGNRQYISTGNLVANDRVCLFLMDYKHRSRLKIYARAEQLTLDAEAALANLVSPGAYKARPERIFKLRLEAFDWNCSQHITSRFSEDEVEEAVRPLRDRLIELEEENAMLRSRTTISETH